MLIRQAVEEDTTCPETLRNAAPPPRGPESGLWCRRAYVCSAAAPSPSSLTWLLSPPYPKHFQA